MLDGSGFPVISYVNVSNGHLRVLHCNDVNCAGADDSVTSPDTSGTVDRDTSIALDAAGNPVVAFYDATNAKLKILHCNDPNCAPGGDSITVPDTTALVGNHASMALDAAGNPVVSYYNDSTDDLRILHCNDPNCAGGNESITDADTTGDVGQYTSLALDAAGRPIVSYSDVTNDDLRLLYCDDPNCAPGGNVVSPHPTPSGTAAASSTSLTLDPLDRPIVAFHQPAGSPQKLRVYRELFSPLPLATCNGLGHG